MVILVVEDEVIIAYACVAELEEAGHTVIGPASTSAQAVALAREHSPDIALIDVDLEAPGTGIRLARELREQHDGLVVVFTTGQADIARANADCAIGLMTKPYDPGELPAVVTYARSLCAGQRRVPPGPMRSFERFAKRERTARKSNDATV